MKARIRDFFENKDGWIFAVADYIHPMGLRSLLRYIPDQEGDRAVGKKRYRKTDFDESFRFLRAVRPQYIHDLHVVPEEDVVRLFKPTDGLKHVTRRDGRVRRIADILASGVPYEEMGITGSLLVDLQGPNSDIDFVVYGSWWWKARDIVMLAKVRGDIGELDEATWEKIYSKRKPEISFEEFVLHEKRKGNRGMIDGTYFDLLFTRDWSQISSAFSSHYKPIGSRKIEAKVIDAEFAFDSPAIFLVDHEEVDKILCYSHTYAGQALVGETIEAQGVLEESVHGMRLVVGTTREARGEWIKSLTLLEGRS